ncbi:MAG: hypothetical protein ACKVOK_05660 [Flavobacteriales bacterium]
MKGLMYQTGMRWAIVACGLAAFGALYVAMIPYSEKEHSCFGRSGDLPLDSLWQGSNSEFSSAGTCDHCHGFDDAGLASVDLEGADVNLVDDWSSTMMANSAKDPFWRAKVSHEVFINPTLQVEIEGTCTKCHAPLGRFAGIMNGQSEYSIAEMVTDGVALDGVSCLACHRQLPQPEIALHTGNLIFDDDSIAYGPYFNPLITPMALYSGYTPEQSFHIKDSKLCAACHSLVTPTVDMDGIPTGGEFVEQATWHEWLNSSYPAMEISCQKCHMPDLGEQAVKLAAGYDTPPRTPFSLHTLAGGNVTMLKMMRDNNEELGIFANDAQFNETINATIDNLQQQSLLLEVTEINRTPDTIYVDVKLVNSTGHKLPSGYPARRMTLVLTAEDALSNSFFQSGGFDENQYVDGENPTFEPHYDIITDEDQVQIYEMVMGDINGDRTNVLLRASSHLKDNRLVPLGFSESGALYDTTEIVLNIPDANFNHDPSEGSGSDIIHYRIPTNGYSGLVHLEAAVYYQSLPPVWLEGILDLETPEANAFSAMYANADKAPVLMKQMQIDIAAYQKTEDVDLTELFRIQVLRNGLLSISSAREFNMELYTLDGKLVFADTGVIGKNTFHTGKFNGAFLCVMRAKTGERKVQKIVLQQD